MVFTALSAPLKGTVFDAGGMGGNVTIRLSRNHNGTSQHWSGSAWTGSGPYWTASVAPSGGAGTYNWSANVPWPSGSNLPRGAYSLLIRAYDNAGNRSDISRTVNIGAPDGVAPALAINTPTDGELIDNTQRGLTSIAGTANDGNGAGVAYVEVTLAHKWSQQFRWWNGASWIATTTKLATALNARDAQGNHLWNVSAPLPSAGQLATGQYYLGVLAYDRFGNRSVGRHVFNATPFDGTPPVAKVTFPAYGQQLYDLPAIRGTASDVGSGVSLVSVTLMRRTLQSNGGWLWNYWNGAQWVTQTSAATILPGSSDADWTRAEGLPSGADLPPGEYGLMFNVHDRYNNVSGYYDHAFSIVPVPPLAVDAHIRADSSGAWLGEGFSNADAQGQTLAGTIQGGETQIRFVRIKMSGGNSSKTVRVSASNWANFAATGGSARFFDAPVGGNDITSQITSASGWNTAMSNGGEKQIRAEVSAPTNVAAGAIGALTFRVEADPTSETSALDVVKATWQISAPAPDLSIRASNGLWLGETVCNDDGAGQTLERVAAPSHVVRGEIQLAVADAADGQIVRWSVPNWDAFRANGWSAKFFDAPQIGDEITGQITGEGWTSQHTGGYQQSIGFEVTVPANAADVTRVLNVRAQVGAGASDVVKASVRVPFVEPPYSGDQSIGGTEYSLDGGVTWKTSPTDGSVITVPQWSSVGIRAIKGNPALDWPDEPFKPAWIRDGVTHWGEKVFLSFPEATPEGESDQTAQVECGNVVTFRVRVQAAP